MKVLTKKDWNKIEEIGKTAFENARGCRNAVSAETNAVSEAVRSHRSRSWKGWKDVALIVRVVQRNYGTRRHSDYRECVDVVAVHPAMYKETNCFIYGIKKDTIIAVVKRG